MYNKTTLVINVRRGISATRARVVVTQPRFPAQLRFGFQHFPFGSLCNNYSILLIASNCIPNNVFLCQQPPWRRPWVVPQVLFQHDRRQTIDPLVVIDHHESMHEIVSSLPNPCIDSTIRKSLSTTTQIISSRTDTIEQDTKICNLASHPAVSRQDDPNQGTRQCGSAAMSVKPILNKK